MNEAQDVFEREMRANGMYDNGGTAMVRDPETGGYADSDTNAMWAGFLLAFGVTTELLAALEAFRSAVPDNRHSELAGVDPYQIDESILNAIDAAIAKAKCE